MRQTGSHLPCAVLGSPWDCFGSVSVHLILRFTNSPFLWSRSPASAQGRVKVPGVKSGEILPGRVSLSHQRPLMPPHTCPCPLPLSLHLGLSLQTLARGHEGHHGAPSSEKTFAAVVNMCLPHEFTSVPISLWSSLLCYRVSFPGPHASCFPQTPHHNFHPGWQLLRPPLSAGLCSAIWVSTHLPCWTFSELRNDPKVW